ncbi:MAG: acyl-CoA dehydrogenase family protein [Syntrophales bacterium LBB04]|nr:acyl-CoA dehydrogenase family protein [Syntrophales bacterium LBB04]
MNLREKISKEILKEIAKKGWFGAMIPKRYGGHFEDWEVTGACFINEEVSRAGEVSGPFTSTMIGSIHQSLHFGSEEQRLNFQNAIRDFQPRLGVFQAAGINSGLRLSFNVIASVGH